MAALKSFDGSGPHTELEGMFKKKLILETSDDIIRKVYVEKMTVTQIASLAPLVTDTAKEGDEVAEKLVHESGEQLGRLITTVIDRLKIGKMEFPIATVGGMFKIGRMLLEPMKKQISAIAPKAYLSTPRMGPAMGSIIIAFGLAGIDLTDRRMENLQKANVSLPPD
jgi:N-acetylglucosamine kinase-like BadF-type ATPase